MSFEEKIDKYKLIAKVEHSNSDEETENDVNSAIKEATDILKAAYESEKKELLTSFKKEYNDLRQSVLESLQEDRKITRDELTRIKLELSDITTLAKENNIKEKTSIIGKITNKITQADLEGIKIDVAKLRKKNINKLSPEEAKGALEYLNSNYSSRYEGANFFSKIYNGEENSISELKNKLDVRIFQEKLINIILGNNKGYNSEYIKSYSPETGNNLVKISEYENKLKNNEKINLETTAVYILKLSEENPNKMDFIKSLRNLFGQRYSKIGEAIKGESQNKDKAKKILEKYGIVKKGFLFVDFFNGLFEKFENFISSPKEFFFGVKNLKGKEAEKFITFLQENNEYLKGEFKKNLLEKFDGVDNKEKIVDEFIEKLLQAKNIGEIYVIIDNYKEISLKELNTEEITHKTLELQGNQAQQRFIIAQENGNTEEMEEAKIELLTIQEGSILNENTTQEEKDEIVKKYKAGENYEEIVKDLRKNNKSLDKKLKEFENDFKNEYKEELKKEVDNESTNKEKIINKNEYTPLDSGFFQITTPNNEIIIISEQEKQITQNNPEALKNLIDFYELLKGLNLISIWEYREDLITAMGDININIEDKNLFSKSDVIKYLNNIIRFINNTSGKKGEKIMLSNNLGTLKNELKKYSGANSVLDGEKTYNINSEDRFANDLRKFKIIGDWDFKRISFNNYMIA